LAKHHRHQLRLHLLLHPSEQLLQPECLKEQFLLLLLQVLLYLQLQLVSLEQL